MAQQRQTNLQQYINQINAAKNGQIIMPPNFSGFNDPFASQPQEAFQRGDRVVLLSGNGDRGGYDFNPIWGHKGQYIAGTIKDGMGDRFIVIWDNGHPNLFHLQSAQIVHLASVEAKKKKHVKLDTSSLDALVIADDVRMEILAILKQHQHSAKLFDEWGLGEVIEYGRGMTFMFYGKPGTGKTWGANCIAKALGTELLTVNASNIQTSEPGGANRNIENAFKSAKEQNKVLFLDECDSLITTRSEVGMILSSEINTLLTEIEKFEGVCILATNRVETMDEALERRIALTVEFPEPDYDARLRIWQKLIPKKMPLTKDVKLEKLAEEKLTGGQIKNAVLQAARLALSQDKNEVELTHFDQAIKRIHKSRSLMGKGSLIGRARIKSDYVKVQG